MKEGGKKESILEKNKRKSAFADVMILYADKSRGNAHAYTLELINLMFKRYKGTQES